MLNMILNWKNCEKEFIKKVTTDESKISSIIKISKIRLKIIEDAKIDDETCF